MTRPAAPLFCRVCGHRIHTYDYKVRNGLPLHDDCFEKPPEGPREILAVFWGEAEAKGGADYEAGRVFGGPKGGPRTNVRVVREKIRAEQTWRWGWIVVVDAKKHSYGAHVACAACGDVHGCRIWDTKEGG